MSETGWMPVDESVAAWTPVEETPPKKAGPLGRFLSSAATALGAPEKLSDYWMGPAEAVRHPIESAKLLGQSILGAHTQAAESGLSRMHQPGFANKLVGGVEYLESGIPLLGPSLVHAGRQMESGDVAGGLGTTAGTAAPIVLGSPEARALAARPIEALRAAPSRALAPKPEIARLVPEAQGLPAKALSGGEKIFRAAAPAAMEQDFRANLYRATPDLAEIARQTPLKQKGGLLRPDLRVREFVTNVDNHLAKMYSQERAPQIARNAQAQVPIQLSADAADAAKFLARTMGRESDRMVAGRIAEGDTASLADLDKLARGVNKELLRYERMTPSEQATARVTNRRISGFKELDHSLSDSIGGELERRGEPGIRDYEQRYAALKDVRDALARRMNAVEAQRFIDRIREFATVRNVGFSAGRAAIGGTGRGLAKGMKLLGQTGIAPARAMPMPPRLAGYLSGGTLLTPPSGYSVQTPGELFEQTPQLVQPKLTAGRGPLGRFKRVYLGEPNE